MIGLNLVGDIMFGHLLPLIFSIAVLGCVIYGLVAAVKPLLGDFGKTPKGTALKLALPLALGAVLGMFLNELQLYASDLFGAENSSELPMAAGAMLGLFAGTFSSYIHTTAKKLIKKGSTAVEESLDSDEAEEKEEASEEAEES